MLQAALAVSAAILKLGAEWNEATAGAPQAALDAAGCVRHVPRAHGACSAVTWFGRGHSAVAAPGADRWRLTDMPTDGCKKERPYPYNRPLVVGDTFLQDRVRLFSPLVAASLLLHLCRYTFLLLHLCCYISARLAKNAQSLPSLAC